MAATYYAQIMRAYRWDDIRAAIDEAIRRVRLVLDEDPTLMPSDGIDAGVNGVLANAYIDPIEQQSIVACVYLGQTYRDSPSGAFYAPWSAIPDSVRERDQHWYAAFERVANKYDIEPWAGEGDPTDTYVGTYVDINDPADLALMPDDIGAK